MSAPACPRAHGHPGRALGTGLVGTAPARRRRALRGALGLAALLGLAAAPAAAAVELEGTWHVLVHYTDPQTAHPEALRWDDRIWVFTREGGRLRWTEYPIVVFRDASGRFESLGTNRQSRVLGAWEPNPGQRDQIREGLEVNERGSRTKTLRGSADAGWRSRDARQAFSANTLVYSTVWSVDDPQGLPVFRIEEALAGARTENLEGVTRYRTTEVAEGGDVLRGRFARDGTRTGTFRMRRAAAVRDLEGSGRSNQERLQEYFATQMGLGPLLRESGGEDLDPEALRERVVEALEEAMRERGLDPERYRPEIRRMADRILEEVDRGRSPEQIERMIREGEIRALPAP